MKLFDFRGYKRRSSKPSTDLGTICLHNIVRTLCCAMFVLHDLPFREIKLVDPQLLFCMLLTWRTWMYKPTGTGQVWLSFDIYLHITVRVIPNNTIYVQKIICNLIYSLAYTIHVDVPSAWYVVTQRTFYSLTYFFLVINFQPPAIFYPTHRAQELLSLPKQRNY